MNVGLSTRAFSYDIERLMNTLSYITGHKINFFDNCNPEQVKDIDLLVLSGGEDISPEIYGEKNTSSYGVNTNRDSIDIANLMKAFELDKKVLGICRGHQLINAVFGGKLIQNITNRHDNEHTLKLHPNFKYEINYVNSLHHQGVISLGKFMQSLATYKDVHEITKSRNNKILSVQFHPEFMNESSKIASPILKMLGDFLNA